MRLIIDFSDSGRARDANRLYVVPRRNIFLAVIIIALALLAASYIIANAIAAYWVASDSPIVRTIARQEVMAQNANRNRLWQESIGALQEEIAATNTRLIALYHKGAMLSDKAGLPGDEMFNAQAIAGDRAMMCFADDNAGGGDDAPDTQDAQDAPDETPPSTEQKQTIVSDVILRQNRYLDELNIKYDALLNQQIVNAVLESTLPMVRPVIGHNWITSGYGYRRDPFSGRRAFHSGYDYAARTGTPIIAAATGVVIHAGRLGRYGNTVHIYHGDSISTLYGHMHEIYVDKWTYVRQDEVIGTIGSTGRSTGPHLHYEVRVNNRPKSIRRTLGELRKQRNIADPS